MVSNSTSVTADLQNLIRRFRVISELDTDIKFLSFAESVETNYREFYGLREEVCRLQDELVKTKAENNSLQLKLKNARQLVNLEKDKRIAIEREKYELEQQISLVREMLGKGNINETKEKLQLLSSSLSGAGRGSTGGRPSIKEAALSPINENQDTMASIVSLSDIDMSEDGELEMSKTRSGRNYKRSMCSMDKSNNKRKSSPGRNQSGNKKFHQSWEEDKENDQNIKNVHEKVVEFAHQRLGHTPSAPPLFSDENRLDITERKLHTAVNRGGVFSTPILNYQDNKKMQLTTPGGSIYLSPLSSPLMRNLSSSKVNTRAHSFISKTIYWTDYCQPCNKRFRFGKTALKCRDCRATAHVECKDAVPLPCVPTASTPGGKNPQLGSIVDYTPRIPPMIPALVIHCTNEVENRGLNEVGVYRVPGAASQVKELKNAFLRGKGTPNLGKVEIHVVCGVLKDFLRSLKEPLVTHTLWKDFIAASEKAEPQDMQAALYQAISDLPQPNRDTLAWITCHLQRVAECEECKMPTANLAKIFGPTIVGYSVSEPEPQVVFEETRKQQKVMEMLLEISTDYWRTFINVPDDSLNNRFTPEKAGAYPSSNTRRKSILSMSPFPARDTMTPRKYNSRK